MKYLTVDDCIAINRRHSTRQPLVNRAQSLRAVVFMPQSREKGIETFRDVVEKAAILGHLMVKLAPFAEANAVTAREAVYQFLERNDRAFNRADAEQTWELVAMHNASYASLQVWLRLHMHDVQLMPLQVILTQLNQVAKVVRAPHAAPETTRVLDRAGARIVRQLVQTFNLPDPLWTDLTQNMDAIQEAWGDELSRAQ